MMKIKMNKTNDIVMTVFGVALSAPLFLLAIVGCAFNPPSSEGPPPRTSGIFCDFEKRERSCATESDLANGVNLAEPDVDGFWNDKQMFGLDFSDAAKGACGGPPQKVLFAGPFPDGLNECVNPNFVGNNGHPTLDAACSALCEEKRYNEMGYDCSTARASHRAVNLFVNACTTEGTLMPAFVDPRRLPKLVNLAWTDAVSVQVIDNTVRKTSATPDYDAGAASKVLLMGQEGAFEFTAIEQDKERAAGFARGPGPDVDASDADILYRVVLRTGGILEIVEMGLVVFSTEYPKDSRIRMVVADGSVHYYLNRAHLYSGSPTGVTPLHVSVSLRDMGATIANAGITF